MTMTHPLDDGFSTLDGPDFAVPHRSKLQHHLNQRNLAPRTEANSWKRSRSLKHGPPGTRLEPEPAQRPQIEDEGNIRQHGRARTSDAGSKRIKDPDEWVT